MNDIMLHLTKTPGVARKINGNDELATEVFDAFTRFLNGDWGPVIDEEDRKANDNNLKPGGDLYALAAYKFKDGDEFWIIRDPVILPGAIHNVTILLPKEY